MLALFFVVSRDSMSMFVQRQSRSKEAILLVLCLWACGGFHQKQKFLFRVYISSDEVTKLVYLRSFLKLKKAGLKFDLCSDRPNRI